MVELLPWYIEKGGGPLHLPQEDRDRAGSQLDDLLRKSVEDQGGTRAEGGGVRGRFRAGGSFG